MIDYCKRLIEVDLPIKRISKHARREKSIRYGHISTLHIWWARRPLAACRAVVCASLWPDPADELCPYNFQKAAKEQMVNWANNYLKLLSEESYSRFVSISKNNRILDDPIELRRAVLDFIADFSNLDNSAVPEFLETSRVLTQKAHEGFGGEYGTVPLVVDPFSGGGTIPLESLRIGADAFAMDLNPVAVLLNKVILQFIPKFGQELADEVLYWGNWVLDKTKNELETYYPQNSKQTTVIAYIWARTILSEAPSEEGLPIEIPLIRSFWLAKKKKRKSALRWVRDSKGIIQTKTIDIEYPNNNTQKVKRPLLEIFEPKKDSDVESGTVARGSAICPITGYTTPVKSVRKQGKDGRMSLRLLAIAEVRDGAAGRLYRKPTSLDYQAIRNAESSVSKIPPISPSLSAIPQESTIHYESFVNRGPIYGMNKWSDYFTPRQGLALSSFAKNIRDIPKNDELGVAIKSCLALTLSKLVDLCNSLTLWEPVAECPRHLISRGAIPFFPNFAESNPLSTSSGSWSKLLEIQTNVIRNHVDQWRVGDVMQADAHVLNLPDNSIDFGFTDPPYYYTVQYADLSDMFYIWIRRVLFDVIPEIFRDTLTPKDNEIIVQSPAHEYRSSGKNRAHYERGMKSALSELRRVVKPSGLGTIVFANTTTSGWESLIQALVESGWTVTASWPIDTEMTSRIAAREKATLSSSVHLICRPRKNTDGSFTSDQIGDFRDILSELPKRVHKWLPRLANEGIVGADAIFACLGPALEIYSRYSSVEKASGEIVSLNEYLEEVWAAVSREALNMIFMGADASGFEEDARLTAMWLWTISTGLNGQSIEDDNLLKSVGYTLEYDAGRKIAQGLGVYLEKLTHLVEIKGDKARLLPVSERSRYLFGREGVEYPNRKRKKKDAQIGLGFLEEMEKEEKKMSIDSSLSANLGKTVLDQLHQCMILFATGRSEAMKRLIVEEGVGRDQRFWKLAQALSALYPKNVDEKRWVDGVLARKKSFGF